MIRQNSEFAHRVDRFPLAQCTVPIPVLRVEGALRGREFGDQAQIFGALAVMHNAVVGRNMIEVEGAWPG